MSFKAVIFDSFHDHVTVEIRSGEDKVTTFEACWLDGWADDLKGYGWTVDLDSCRNSQIGQHEEYDVAYSGHPSQMRQSADIHTEHCRVEGEWAYRCDTEFVPEQPDNYKDME